MDRRKFLSRGGTALLTFYLGGCAEELTPGQARERGVPLQVLSAAEVATLDALGETLLPGAAAAGLSHFIDHQLGAPRSEQLLMIKYLGLDPPFDGFYRSGLAGLDGAARAAHGSAFAALAEELRRELVAAVAQSDPPGWSGPPAPLFYFVTRNDSLDVVYGTREGIEGLGIPYMAHILPPSRWGA